MSSTFSSCARLSSANEWVRSTIAWSASTSTVSAEAAMATTCWASTSSGLRGTTVRSISPSRMRRATTAHSSRSARNLGKMRPLETSPTPCPARPMRCRPAVTDFGDSTCRTRSTAPMSMPSSSEEVATRHGSSPALSCSSTTIRSSRASEPWCARAIGAGGSIVATPSCSASSFEPQGEPLGAAPVVDEHDRRAVLAHEPQQLGVDGRPDRLAGRLPAGERVELHVGLVRLDHATPPGRGS